MKTTSKLVLAAAGFFFAQALFAGYSCYKPVPLSTDGHPRTAAQVGIQCKNASQAWMWIQPGQEPNCKWYATYEECRNSCRDNNMGWYSEWQRNGGGDVAANNKAWNYLGCKPRYD